MAQWKIRRRQGECSACEHVFTDGERHASLLRVDGDDLQRGDLCDACWAEHETGGDDLIWWFTHHQENKKRTLALDLATMERLFMELADRDTEQLKEVRYLLCLLLMRKKRVKLERILRDENGESFIVHRPKSEDRYTVEVFDFTPERMAEVRAHLQAIFDGVDEDESLSQAARGEEEDGQDSDSHAEDEAQSIAD